MEIQSDIEFTVEVVSTMGFFSDYAERLGFSNLSWCKTCFSFHNLIYHVNRFSVETGIKYKVKAELFKSGTIYVYLLNDEGIFCGEIYGKLKVEYNKPSEIIRQILKEAA